jgi:predicted ATPase/class 3 adenylate cyclase
VASDFDVNELPTGTVTLLLADVEGSTRLWESRPEEMTAAFAALDRALSDLVDAHHGVRPVEQGEGDSFVVAFARASDAVACALGLQKTPLAPIRLRIGLHTGEVQLRDEANYIGPTINRTARIRDLAHGGQTVMSGTTEDLVVDALPADAWLLDLGRHELRGVPRPERVVQLCHADLQNEFPPLRTTKAVGVHNCPLQLTSFVGRAAQITEVRELLAANRLVTLTGAGGVGKTRLALQVAADLAAELDGGVWYVDLAPITDSDIVPVAVVRALDISDQPGRSTMDALLEFVGDQRMLMVLDNCEHLLDPCATLMVALLGACPRLTVLATSREPIGLSGEVIFRVPSLSLRDEAGELFTERARRVHPDFKPTDDNLAVLTEICRRLDGMPLAIELAAARVRALSLDEILSGLHDRFRLLTGGTRTAVRRQQTLLASVDWSHELLTDPERVLLRRLSVFLGGFDLNAAQTVAVEGDIERYQVLDLLTLLVDKSLVVAENRRGQTRYRLLETVRQYALEKLGGSGEADIVRARHRDYYTAQSVALDSPGRTGDRPSIHKAEIEFENLRAAFTWSRESSEIELASALASSLQPLWLGRGRMREGLAWFDAALIDLDARDVVVSPAVRARAIADRTMLAATLALPSDVDQVEQAVVNAREIGDPTLLARALVAQGAIRGWDLDIAAPYFDEAIGIARAIGDRWRLTQICGWRVGGAWMTGDPRRARTVAHQGLGIAEALGVKGISRQSRWLLGWSQMWMGNLAGAVEIFQEVVAESEAADDALWRFTGLSGQGLALAYHGQPSAAEIVTNVALDRGAKLGGWFGFGDYYGTMVFAALGVGDVAAVTAAAKTCEPAWRRLETHYQMAGRRNQGLVIAESSLGHAALAVGDLVVARRWADAAVTGSVNCFLMLGLTTRARVAIAQGDTDVAKSDAHGALALGTEIGAYLLVPDALECLADLSRNAGEYQVAARLFGAADAARRRMGVVRFKVYDPDYDASITRLRDAMGHNEFTHEWQRGVALSTEEAIAYAQRGRESASSAPVG